MDFYRTGGVGSECFCGGLDQNRPRAMPDEMNMTPSLGADTQTKFPADDLTVARGLARRSCGRSTESFPAKSENRPARIGQMASDAVGHVINPLRSARDEVRSDDRIPSVRHDHEIMLARCLLRRRWWCR